MSAFRQTRRVALAAPLVCSMIAALYAFSVGPMPAAPPGRSGPPEPGQTLTGASGQQGAEQQRRVLQPEDLEYQGSFAVPRKVNDKTTAFTNLALAMRYVEGKRQFFAGAGTFDSAVYEMDFPGLADVRDDVKKCPQAKCVKAWGDIWQGKCTITGKTNVMRIGLYWDEAPRRLYWTYAGYYNASGANDPCYGWTDLEAALPKAHGPFRIVGGRVRGDDRVTRACNGSCRGGITRIPEWFAKRYTNGETLALGFGGYYNIISSGVSMGPALFTVRDPVDGTQDYPAVPCIAHTFTSQKGEDARHRANRSPEYTGTTDWVAPLPVQGVGYWTAMDTIRGAGCWVDLPDVSGMVFMPKIATGLINYQAMNGRAKRGPTHNWLYIYAPADLASVALGKRLPWTLEPSSRTKFPTPQGGIISGMVFEAKTRTLFVLAAEAVSGNVENYPMIHAYRIKTKD